MSQISGRSRTFVEAQPILLTATAPLSGSGTVNLSPKGPAGSLAVVDERPAPASGQLGA